MNGAKTKNTIYKKAFTLLDSLPKKLAQKCLLTGGSAAFLYGSDRPFSNDIDFMVPKNLIKEFEKYLKIKFEFRKHKPIFHSLVASVEISDTSFDLIAESIIKPLEQEHEFGFLLNGDVTKKKQIFKKNSRSLPCVPKELLVLIKLLAGRGKELGKYDLYDVEKILEKNKDFNFEFFVKLIKSCCKPTKTALTILRHHTKRLKDSESVRILKNCLASLR